MLFEFDELVSILLRDVGKVLLDVYQVYFEHELKYSNTQLIALHPNAYKYFASLKSKDITLALLPHFK